MGIPMNQPTKELATHQGTWSSTGQTVVFNLHQGEQAQLSAKYTWQRPGNSDNKQRFMELQ